MPWWFAPSLVLMIAGVVLICLSGAVLEAWREARWAEHRRPDPGPWLLDKAGVWWVLTDVGGYVRVPPELQPQRTTLGPKDPPRPVSRSWIVAEIGVAEMMDPRELPVGDGLTPLA